MTIELREYQINAIEKIKESYRQGKNSPCLMMPTGGGKTICFSKIAESASVNNKRVIIVVHRSELLYQASNKLTQFSIKHGKISPEFTPAYYELIQIASIDTLIRRLDFIQNPDLIIIDEAHHLLKDNKWGKVVKKFPSAKILGVTATPARTNGDGLGIKSKGFFDDLIIGSSVSELTDLGYLCPAEYYAPPIHIDFSRIKIKLGDYDSKGLSAETNKPNITGDAIKHYIKYSSNLPAIAFCVDRKHAKDVANQFNLAGICSEFIDGTLSSSDRKLKIEGLTNGRIKVLTSVNLISEGTDIPVVNTAILLRKTRSLSLHLQMIGRVLRPHPDKNKAIIIDHVGNTFEHGFADSEHIWSLEGKQKKRNDIKGKPITQCEYCYRVYHSIKSNICPYCKEQRPTREKKISYSDEELIKVTDEFKNQKNIDIKNAKSIDDLKNIALKYGYKPGWVEHRKKYLPKRYIPHPAENL